jgi:hypothetical protein
MPKPPSEGAPAAGRGLGSWALYIRGAARRTGCRVLYKVRVHEQVAQPRIEMPTMNAELIIIVVSGQFREPIQKTFPEE